MENPRVALVRRDTKETQIQIELSLDGVGKGEISTGIPFLDHMLILFSKHGFFDLSIKAEGDIQIDYHHLVEDMGISLGQAFREALATSPESRGTVFSFFPWTRLSSAWLLI